LNTKDIAFMVSEAVIAIVLLGFLAVLAYFWQRPPEMSEGGRRWFLRGVRFLAISAVFLAADFAIFTVIEDVDFNSWRGRVFWVAVLGSWVNAAALFSFFRVLANLLPFTKGDAADVTPAGIIFGLGALFMQLVLLFFLLLCSLVP
jgi:hypothetical protein